MRNVLAVVALSAACGDNLKPAVNTPDPDAAVADMSITPLVDAPPSINGTWRDTFHTVAGPVTMSACTFAPAAIDVDATTAVATPYPGACAADGSFKIEAPHDLGTYYLRVQGTLYETDKRDAIDVSIARLGRKDHAAINGATLGLTMTNLQSWTSGDFVIAFSPNVGHRQTLLFTSGAPSAAATTLAATANWSGSKLDSSKADALQLVQLGKHTTGGGLGYVSLDRTYSVAPFTMTPNSQHAVSGAFVAPAASSQALSIDVASFNQFAAVAAPTVTLKSIQGTASATVSTDAVESPPLISFAQNADGVDSLDFGTLAHGDPFPAEWHRMVKVQVNFNVPYTWSGATGNHTAAIARVVTKATADAGEIGAELGPPIAVKLDGDDAMIDTMISTVPVVSWSAPAVGTPTDYEIQVFEAKVNGTALSFSSVLRLVTKQTSVRIPTGYLLGQRQYLISVRARAREAVDVYVTPLRAGTQWSSAETLSAIVTTQL